MNKMAIKLFELFDERFPGVGIFSFQKLANARLCGTKTGENLETISQKSADELWRVFSGLSKDELSEWFVGLLLQETPVREIFIYRGKVYRDSSMKEEVRRVVAAA